MVFSSEEMDTVEEDDYINNGHRKQSGYIDSTSNGQNGQQTITPTQTANINLEPCLICGRTFIPNTLIKHIGICEKMMTKKRKIFDSSRQRREGTDLALLPPPPILTNKHHNEHKLSPPKTVQPQRKQSDPLITRKQQQNVNSSPQQQHQQQHHYHSQTTSPKPMAQVKRNLGPTSEQCPHCERFFGMKAYDRHVEWCKEKMRLNNPQTSQTLNVAKERLQARTQYRAPSVKTKREMTRRKYSGCEDSVFDFPTSMCKSLNNSGQTDDKRSMNNSMTSSITSEGNDEPKKKPKKLKNKMAQVPSQHSICEEAPVSGSHKKKYVGGGCSGGGSGGGGSGGGNVVGGGGGGDLSTTRSHELPSKIPTTLPNTTIITPPPNVCKKQIKQPYKRGFCAINDVSINQGNNDIMVTPYVSSYHRLREDRLKTKQQICNNNNNNNNIDDDDDNIDDDLIVDESLLPPPFILDDFLDDINSPIEPNLSETHRCKTPISFEIKMEVRKSFRRPLKNQIDNESENMTLMPTSSLPPQFHPTNNEQNHRVNETDDEEDDDVFIESDSDIYKPPYYSHDEYQQYKYNSGTNSEESIHNTNVQIITTIQTQQQPQQQQQLLTRQQIEIFDSTNNLNEFNINNNNNNNNVHEQHQSLSSSFIPPKQSRALSDNYDPFLSAKRQLEELFSPTHPTNTSTPTSNTQNTKLLMTSKNYSTPTSSSMSRSLFNTSNQNLTNIKSNFKRTSSLRLPKTKTTKPTTKSIFSITNNKQPTTTIQRGISIDDGPISTNFLKSDEFDEMPVKAAFIPKAKPIVLRDPSAVGRRKDLKLDLKQRAATGSFGIGKIGSDNDLSNQLSKTDSMAVFLKYEHDLSISPTLTEKEIKDKNNIFNKRLSSITTNSLSTTPVKSPDNIRNNTINTNLTQTQQSTTYQQQQQQPTHYLFSPNNVNDKKSSLSLPTSSTQLLSSSPSQQSNIFLFPEIQQSQQQQQRNVDPNFIDPKLINLCDNLPINIKTKLSDDDDDEDDDNNDGGGVNINNNDDDGNDTNSSFDSNETPKNVIKSKRQQINTIIPIKTKQTTTTIVKTITRPTSQTTITQLPNFLIENNKVTTSSSTISSSTSTLNNINNNNNNSQRNSGEQRRLKRQLKLSKDNFLYDNSNNNDNNDNNNVSNTQQTDLNNTDIYSDNYDKTISIIDHVEPYKINQNNQCINTTDAMFDDFDLEEFISSFEDDDQHPIFKDYKELLARSSSSIINHNNNNNNNKSKSVTPTFKTNNNNNNNNNNYRSTSKENVNMKSDSRDTFTQERALILSSLESLKSNNSSSKMKHDHLEIISPTNTHIINNDHDDDVDDDDDDAVTLLEIKENNYGNNSDGCYRSPQSDIMSPPPPPPHHHHEQLQPPRKLEELTRAERELLKSVQELDRMCESSSTMYPIDSDVSSVESFPMTRKLGSKFSADSAYGSLSRQSPIERPIRKNVQRTRTTNIDCGNVKLKNHSSKSDLRSRENNNSLSSSGSDTSLPPIGNIQKSDQQQQQQLQHKDSKSQLLDSRMSKFCHECGCKFMINQAKFCMECGVRRVILE